MAKMTDRELLALVNAEFDTAMGAPDGDISAERAKAWNYYLSKKLGNEVEGQSSVVTSDVADIIDGIMPSLLRIFTTAENLISFDAVGPEDVPAAEQESDYVNYVFFKQNPAFTVLYNWFFDALVQKNGIVKAWWDESEKITTESYAGLSEAELFQLLQDDELEPVERSERVETTVAEDGVTITEDTVHDIVFKRKGKCNRVKVANVPPEEYRISSDARDLDPSEARMVGQEREVTRAELIAMGFDRETVMDLAAYTIVENSDESIARYNKSDEDRDAHSDRSQDLILLRECYIKVDLEKSGRSELRQIFTAGNVLLSNEAVDRQPFHVISPQPLPHKHFGRATAEKVMDVQEVATTLTRQILDNLYRTNQPGHAVWEQGIGENTLDDLLTTRVGRIARFNRPVSESYAPMTVPFTAGATFPMLEWFDKVKRDRTGVNADSEGLAPDQLKHIQQSVMGQALDVSKMKIEAIARIFAETGIKSLFLHIHELLQKHQNKAQVVQLRNQWIQVDPSQWRTRMDMTVNIGLGIGSRESNLIHLNAIWEKQLAMLQSGLGGLSVTPQNLFRTAAEIVKNANLKQPEMFFTNPGDQMMPPPNEEQMKLHQQALAQQERQQELDAQEQTLKWEKLRSEHERGMEQLSISRQKMEDDFAEAMEKIRNELTKMELDSGQNVPGSKV